MVGFKFAICHRAAKSLSSQAPCINAERIMNVLTQKETFKQNMVEL